MDEVFIGGFVGGASATDAMQTNYGRNLLSYQVENQAERPYEGTLKILQPSGRYRLFKAECSQVALKPIRKATPEERSVLIADRQKKNTEVERENKPKNPVNCEFGPELFRTHKAEVSTPTPEKTEDCGCDDLIQNPEVEKNPVDATRGKTGSKNKFKRSLSISKESEHFSRKLPGLDFEKQLGLSPDLIRQILGREGADDYYSIPKDLRPIAALVIRNFLEERISPEFSRIINTEGLTPDILEKL